ncbi:MAG: poly-beta-1,6-N-acetyl-D-glucosamine N-deacetylase PgaB [Candidatus Omnitrophica bacterium]|nr:poly-beta-1,6-N-acetyl-D-glucosamine N-deacetylase PgaB [Candidatus Omnitrophota bacterium]
MKQLIIILTILVGFSLGGWTSPSSADEGQNFYVLCYHDVPEYVDDDKYGVDQRSFINTIEYFRTHGYTFISLDDVIQARAGNALLPPQSILLTFDDGYKSFYTFVYPILKEYGIPSVLAIVSDWIESGFSPYVKQDLMTWSQIKEVANDPLVDVISHSHNLHRGVIYNPQGNEAAAAANRKYDLFDRAYEEWGSYADRIENDLKEGLTMLETKTGRPVRAIAWPYGKFNDETVHIAESLGVNVLFALDDQKATTHQTKAVSRFLIHKNPTLNQLLRSLGIKKNIHEQNRIVQVDLDYIYDDDPQKTEINLGHFLDRMKELKPSTVFVQAFADPKGEGNIREVYFPNKILPTRADLLNRVVHQLKSRVEVQVYAWMPTLSFVLEDTERSAMLRVKESRDGTVRLSPSWYQRLSPFSRQSLEIVKQIYADLAENVNLDGVIFQDDAYLNDFEDFHPEAIPVFQKVTGSNNTDMHALNDEQRIAWQEAKVKQLNLFLENLKKEVLIYRPYAKFARTIYAPVLSNTYATEWFAQDYASSLELYDYTVVMAYPYMEKIKMKNRWLRGLVRQAAKFPNGLKKTVFKVQTYHWDKNEWIESGEILQWMRTLVSEGAHHIAYYPDDYVGNHPDIDIIRLMMSKEDFPFERGK